LIPGQDPGVAVGWWIEATDGVNTATWPADGTADFRVYLPPPTEVVAEEVLPGDRIAADRVVLHWTPPETAHEVVQYVVYRNDGSVLRTESITGTTPLVSGINTLSVSALFSTDAGQFEGDPSTTIEIDASIPTATVLDPDHGWPGDILRLTIRGDHLLLDPSDVNLEGPEGVLVESVEVVDANTCQARIKIDGKATPGRWTLILFRGDLPIEVGIPFTIRDDDERPHIVSIQPQSIRQGGSETVQISLSDPLSTAPLVEAGEGVFVESVTVTEDGIEVEITVANDAPLGAHGVEVDDGMRILFGADLTIRDQLRPPKRNCSTVPSAQKSNPAMLFLVLLCWIRRRATDSGA
jgi:hypothetical protein